jgi:hypothetical protein
LYFQGTHERGKAKTRVYRREEMGVPTVVRKNATSMRSERAQTEQDYDHTDAACIVSALQR